MSRERPKFIVDIPKSALGAYLRAALGFDQVAHQLLHEGVVAIVVQAAGLRGAVTPAAGPGAIPIRAAAIILISRATCKSNWATIRKNKSYLPVYRIFLVHHIAYKGFSKGFVLLCVFM